MREKFLDICPDQGLTIGKLNKPGVLLTRLREVNNLNPYHLIQVMLTKGG